MKFPTPPPRRRTADIMKPFFADEKENVYTGRDATRKLERRNDRRFFQQGLGVLEVDARRWNEAQRYQRRTWMEGKGPIVREDYNGEHEIHFGKYAAIKSSYFANALEIGCGPFTNMVRILRRVRVERVTLLDPLITTYLNHPHCAYKRKRMRGREITAIPHAIENFSTNVKFDLVVMINVLEQCFSVPRIFERIISLTAPKGILVFYDKLVPSSSIAEFIDNVFDAGHPLRVSDRVILDFLSENYETLWRKHVPIPLEEYMSYTFDSIYFIGRKREPVR